jgi:hypothetical protein
MHLSWTLPYSYVIPCAMWQVWVGGLGGWTSTRHANSVKTVKKSPKQLSYGFAKKGINCKKSVLAVLWIRKYFFRIRIQAQEAQELRIHPDPTLSTLTFLGLEQKYVVKYVENHENYKIFNIFLKFRLVFLINKRSRRPIKYGSTGFGSIISGSTAVLFQLFLPLHW